MQKNSTIIGIYPDNSWFNNIEVYKTNLQLFL